MDENEILIIFKREIIKRLGCHLKKIVLFGSRARGDHEPDSDYDLLVVLDDISPSITDAVDEIGGDILYHHNKVFAIIPIHEKTIAEKPYEPFLMNAFREGVLWYESA